ncbi:VOC family protein [Chitinophaga sp. sic0106]|uniref:VOC family protein n=1 Tax=Chitinophaga sp. sic0106 TaxID=2854785 RepID=UPI001C495667|nr:VOC family protein [Chitinophaga sp. sic0106]MBV7532638.1 VOC family protein [Chitinophaga sp. sic0106]
MSTLNAYLTLNGNCAEAMNFYKSVVGGELFLMPVKDSPMKEEVPAEFHGAIMHASLRNGDFNLMASDSMSHGPVNFGNSVSLTLSCNDESEAEQYFNGLSAGGTVTMPLAETFWAKRFGMLTDKYGFHWMVNVEKPM